MAEADGQKLKALLKEAGFSQVQHDIAEIIYSHTLDGIKNDPKVRESFNKTAAGADGLYTLIEILPNRSNGGKLLSRVEADEEIEQRATAKRMERFMKKIKEPNAGFEFPAGDEMRAEDQLIFLPTDKDANGKIIGKIINAHDAHKIRAVMIAGRETLGEYYQSAGEAGLKAAQVSGEPIGGTDTTKEEVLHKLSNKALKQLQDEENERREKFNSEIQPPPATPGAPPKTSKER